MRVPVLWGDHVGYAPQELEDFFADEPAPATAARKGAKSKQRGDTSSDDDEAPSTRAPKKTASKDKDKSGGKKGGGKSK